MRRFLLLLIVCIPVLSASAARPGTVPKAGIRALVAECRHYEGAEVVNLGRFTTGALKGALRIAAVGDSDVREALSLMKGVRSLSVFEYEDCAPDIRAGITKKIDRLLGDAEVLMEASDSGEKMKIYGVLDEKSGCIRDFVLYAPSDCTLVCIFGTVSMDSISTLMANE